jgi:regulatory protein
MAFSGKPASAQGPSLKGRVLRWLSQREHSRAELLRKLTPHAVEGDDVQGLLDELTAQGWISDERAAQSVVNRRAAGLGKARLRQELQAKGLDINLIAATLSGVAESESDRAWAVWQRKFGKAPADAREKARQIRFLLSRGFESEAVRRVLRAAESHAANADLGSDQTD